MKFHAVCFTPHPTPPPPFFYKHSHHDRLTLAWQTPLPRPSLLPPTLHRHIFVFSNSAIPSWGPTPSPPIPLNYPALVLLQVFRPDPFENPSTTPPYLHSQSIELYNPSVCEVIPLEPLPPSDSNDDDPNSEAYTLPNHTLALGPNECIANVHCTPDGPLFTDILHTLGKIHDFLNPYFLTSTQSPPTRQTRLMLDQWGLPVYPLRRFFYDPARYKALTPP